MSEQDFWHYDYPLRVYCIFNGCDKEESVRALELLERKLLNTPFGKFIDGYIGIGESGAKLALEADAARSAEKLRDTEKAHKKPRSISAAWRFSLGDDDKLPAAGVGFFDCPPNRAVPVDWCHAGAGQAPVKNAAHCYPCGWTLDERCLYFVLENLNTGNVQYLSLALPIDVSDTKWPSLLLTLMEYSECFNRPVKFEELCTYKA